MTSRPAVDPLSVASRLLRSCAARFERASPEISGTLRVIDTGPGRGGKLCVFAHYDRGGGIARYVVHHLRALAAIGADVVFVSTAPGLDPARLDLVTPFCRRIVLRENRGYDFGSWKVGLQGIALDPYEQLILANDSVYGPLFPLDGVFAKMAGAPADFWGITDSLSPRHHVQSYFLVFNRPVLAAPAFAAFWAAVPFYRSKAAVIRNCEVRLTRLLAEAGFRPGAVCPYDQLEPPEPGGTAWDSELRRLLSRRAVNPSHFLWRQLILRHGCPYLKVELLRDNPARIGDLDRLAETLEAGAFYDRGLISDHLGGWPRW